jgi:hypothetical protein
MVPRGNVWHNTAVIAAASAAVAVACQKSCCCWKLDLAAQEVLLPTDWLDFNKCHITAVSPTHVFKLATAVMTVAVSCLPQSCLLPGWDVAVG